MKRDLEDLKITRRNPLKLQQQLNEVQTEVKVLSQIVENMRKETGVSRNDTETNIYELNEHECKSEDEVLKRKQPRSEDDRGQTARRRLDCYENLHGATGSISDKEAASTTISSLK